MRIAEYAAQVVDRQGVRAESSRRRIFAVDACMEAGILRNADFGLRIGRRREVCNGTFGVAKKTKFVKASQEVEYR